jgi:hypothetical protein
MFLRRNHHFFRLTTTLEPDAPAAVPVAPAAMPVAVMIAARWNIAFLVCLTGQAEAPSTSNDRFKPPFLLGAVVFPYGVEAFPCGTAAFTVSTFFFLSTLACLLRFFLAASIVLFFEALVNSSVPGSGRGP